MKKKNPTLVLPGLFKERATMSLKDWSDTSHKPVNDSGSKGKVGESKNSYSDWRRTVGHGCYANDVDWVEWRIVDGQPVLVAVIETTFYQDKPELRHLLPSYCHAALDRFKRDGQRLITDLMASRLGVPAYFVIARQDLAVFFVCRLSDEVWKQMDESAYRRWIMRLGLVTPTRDETPDITPTVDEIQW